MNKSTKNEVVSVITVEEIKKKYGEWISNFDGNDQHAITKQISPLLIDYVLFLTINDLRKHAAQNPDASIGFNQRVLQLIDAGFVLAQATGIRRLTEKQSNNRTKKVISLKALLDDIRSYQHLLTRDLYLACCNGSNGLAHENIGSEMAQTQFDKLAEVDAKKRSGNDLISITWFDKMNERLKECEDVCRFVNKFIAHASDPTNRLNPNESQIKITLAKLSQCHKAILDVAMFIGWRLFRCGPSSFLPTPQTDPVEHLDKAWSPKRDYEVGRDKPAEFWESNWNLMEQLEFDASEKLASTT